MQKTLATTTSTSIIPHRGAPPECPGVVPDVPIDEDLAALDDRVPTGAVDQKHLGTFPVVFEARVGAPTQCLILFPSKTSLCRWPFRWGPAAERPGARQPVHCLQFPTHERRHQAAVTVCCGLV